MCAIIESTYMKQSLVFLVLFFLIIRLIAQDSVKANYQINGNVKKILELVAFPSSETVIRINNSNKITETDSLGYFHFDNLSKGHYLIQIIGNGFQPKDTMINIIDKSINNLELVIVLNCKISRQVADLDIKKGKPKLLFFGGLAPVAYYGQSKFEKKYNVEYSCYGGCMPPPKECAIEYNKRIFEYLDEKFGSSWRNEVRKDIIGL